MTMAMWDEFADKSIEGDLIKQAIADTEQEIFRSAFDEAPDDDDNYDDTIEQSENIAGETESDDEQIAELMGGRDDGDDEPAPQQQYQHQNQQPEESADMFAEPDRWRRQVINDRTEQLTGGPIPQALLNVFPNREMTFDSQVDRAGIVHDSAVLADQVRYYNEAKAQLSDDIANAADDYGSEVWEAARAHMERNVPQTMWKQFQEGLIVARMNGVDVVGSLINQHGQALAMQKHARQNGYKLPTGYGAVEDVRTDHYKRSSGQGYGYVAPKRGSPEWLEREIFNSAWDD